MAFDCYDNWDDQHPYPWVRNVSKTEEKDEWTFRKENSLKLVDQQSIGEVCFRCWKRSVANDVDLFVSFRASFPQNLPSIMNHVDLSQSPLPHTFAFSSLCYVNKGFLSAYQSIKQQLYETLNDFGNSNEINRIVFIGHSIGGAIATLASADDKVDKYIKYQRIECYTFGAPQVGGENFQKHFEKRVRNNHCARYVNALDIIPRFLSLVNIFDKFPGVNIATTFELIENYCHVPVNAVVLGGHLDVSMDVLNGIINQVGAVMRQGGQTRAEAIIGQSLANLGLSSAQQHSKEAYISGIKAHVGSYTRYIKIISNNEVVRGMMGKTANGTVAIIKQKVLGTMESVVPNVANRQVAGGLADLMPRGHYGMEAVPNAGTIDGIPWVGLISGVDLLVSVAGHAATSFQLQKLQSRMDNLRDQLEEVNGHVVEVERKQDELAVAVTSMDQCMRSALEVVQTQLHTLEVSVQNLPDQLEDTLLKNEIKDLRAMLKTVKNNFDSKDYKTEEHVRDAYKEIGKQVDRLNLDITDRISIKEKCLITHSAILMVCQACCGELNLRMYMLWLQKKANQLDPVDFVGSANKHESMKQLCASLVSTWIRMYGTSHQHLAAALSEAYGLLYFVRLNTANYVIDMIPDKTSLLLDDIGALGVGTANREQRALKIALDDVLSRGFSLGASFHSSFGVAVVSHLLCFLGCHMAVASTGANAGVGHSELKQGVFEILLQCLTPDDYPNIVRYFIRDMAHGTVITSLATFEVYLIERDRDTSIKCLCSALSSDDKSALVDATTRCCLLKTTHLALIDDLRLFEWVTLHILRGRGPSNDASDICELFAIQFSTLPTDQLSQIFIDQLLSLTINPTDSDCELFLRIFLSAIVSRIDTTKFASVYSILNHSRKDNNAETDLSLIWIRDFANYNLAVECLEYLFANRDGCPPNEIRYPNNVLDNLYAKEAEVHFARQDHYSKLAIPGERNIAKVMEVLKMGQRWKHGPSIAALATIYFDGLDGLPRGQPETRNIKEQARVLFVQSVELLTRTLQDQARESQYALFWMGHLTLAGRGGIDSDDTEALLLFTRASLQGHRLSQSFCEPQAPIIVVIYMFSRACAIFSCVFIINKDSFIVFF